MCTKKFLDYQYFKVKLNTTYEDNDSTIHLLKNGKQNSGQFNRCFDAILFHIVYLIVVDEVIVECHPTDRVLAKCGSKPLLGIKFKMCKDTIMNFIK